MSKLIVKGHCDSRFSKMIRFYSKEFPIDRARVARLISTGVRSPVCQPTDIKIVEVRCVTYISIVVSDVTSAVHIRRQTAWNTPKALDWIQDIESTNNARSQKTLWTPSRFKKNSWLVTKLLELERNQYNCFSFFDAHKKVNNVTIYYRFRSIYIVIPQKLARSTMNRNPWKACDTRADHDVPWFSAALDFSISILDISCLVTCTLVVLLSNVRETSHVVWHACGRAKRIILSLSLSVPCASLKTSSSFLDRCLRSSHTLVGNKAARRVTQDPLVCVSIACRTSFTHRGWSLSMQANFAAWLCPIGRLSSTSIKSLPDSILWKPEFECRVCGSIKSQQSLYLYIDRRSMYDNVDKCRKSFDIL